MPRTDHTTPSVRPLAAALALLALAGCRVTDLPLWDLPELPPAGGCEVEVVRDVPYRGDGDGCRRHTLDLFLPKGRRNFPVVFFVHGGAWMMGDNRCCGLYSSVGKHLARHGIAAVLVNYRLSPGVKHPEHIRDVAAAFAWTHAHIAEYGGRPDWVFLLGHSAGGHLVCLLTADEQYLREHGLGTADIRGVVAVSGVYKIPDGAMDLTLGGESEKAFRLGIMLPLRRPSSHREPWLKVPGIPFQLNVFRLAFGTDPELRAAASPVNHVRPGLPPFLLFSAENDLPALPAMAEEFHDALRAAGCDAHWLTVNDRNHNSVMFHAADAGDPVGRGILDFVRQHVGAAP